MTDDIIWIDWNGGLRPVAKDTIVTVKSRMEELGYVTMQAGDLLWEHTGAMDDIVAYAPLYDL